MRSLVSLGAFLLTALPLAAQLRFDPPASHAIDFVPKGVAVADISGDGFEDVVVTANAPDRLDCWFNDCDGNLYFAGSYLYPAGSNPNSTALADVDGDGDLDSLSVLVALGEVHVVFNDGFGGFSNLGTYPVGLIPQQLAVGDVDGDGDVDFAVCDYGGDQAFVYFNDGAGNFTTSTTLAVGSGPSGIALCDFDGDGDLDLVTANTGTGDVTSYLWDSGSSTFGNLATTTTGSAFTPGRVAAGDVTGDGVCDVLVANTDNVTGSDVSVLASVGGALQAGVVWDTGGMGSFALDLADLDGDGDLDVAVANTCSNDVSMLVNDGSGGFPTFQLEASGAGAYDVAAGELTGNNAPDLAVSAKSASQLVVHLNRTTDLGFQLLSGTCPGIMDFEITGATPSGRVVVILGNDCLCSVVPPGNACEGTVLGVANNLMVFRTIQVDANGELLWSGFVGPGCCGECIQIMDLTTCRVSNVVSI